MFPYAISMLMYNGYSILVGIIITITDVINIEDNNVTSTYWSRLRDIW